MRQQPAIFLVGCLVVAPILALSPATPAPAAGEALPQATKDNRSAWVNPLVRATDSDAELSTELLSLSTPLAPGETLRATLKLSNHSNAPLTAVSVTVEQAAAVADTTALRVAQAADRSTYGRVGPTVTLSTPLDPGEEREVTLEFPDFAEFSGTYPVLFSISAAGTFYSTERSTVMVSGESTPDEATPLTLLLPLTETLPIVPGETGEAPERAPLVLSDESLATSLSPGGRLSSLLDAYTTALPTLNGAACLAVDPALIDTVSRMAQGYVVANARADLTEPTVRLRDSWTQDDNAPESTAGQGSQVAADWLAQASELASELNCVAELPWANTDLNAIQRTGNSWLMREALERGTETLSEELGVAPLDNLVIPGSGYLTEDAAPSLAWADDTGIALDQAWEILAAGQDNRNELSEHSTLDDAALPDASAHPNQPAETVQVLVADNTVWSAPQQDRFANLAPGIQAVTYADGLAATLAATGPTPDTVGYSNPELRYDYTLDSATARDATAAAALHLSLSAGDPVLVVPPADLSADSATALLAAAQEALTTATATAWTLPDYIHATEGQTTALTALTEAFGLARPETDRFGAPYSDPAAYTDTEILRAAQQANYTDDLTGIMVNDPSIALTRYGFSAPLRRDVLLALTLSDRRSLGSFDAAVAATSRRLNANRDLLQQLRSSVSLLPPGNVFTRTSQSSPLLLVAQNGLPLPARAELGYQAPAGVHLAAEEELLIPARGSRTIQLTADLPDNSGQTDLTLWLAAADGAAISTPVHIAVQTRAGLASTWAVGIVTFIFLLLAVVFRVGRGRRRRNSN